MLYFLLNLFYTAQTKVISFSESLDLYKQDEGKFFAVSCPVCTGLIWLPCEKKGDGLNPQTRGDMVIQWGIHPVTVLLPPDTLVNSTHACPSVSAEDSCHHPRHAKILRCSCPLYAVGTTDSHLTLNQLWIALYSVNVSQILVADPTDVGHVAISDKYAWGHQELVTE